MHSTIDRPTNAGAADVLRRDSALRLRRRILIAVATSSTVAVGGFAVLAQHTAAGTATTSTAGSTTASESSATTTGVSASSATDSGTSSQSGATPTPAPTTSPVTSSGSHAVSGGS